MTTLSKLGKEYHMPNGGIDFTKEINHAEIAVDTTFFVGAGGKLGRTTVLIVQNIDSVSHAVLFDTSIGISAAHAAVGVPAATYNTYLVEYIHDGALVQLLADGSAGPFPSGSDGGLLILNGETVTLNAGNIRDYSSIDIQAGGLLNITDPSNTWNPTEIYCLGSFNIDGTIQFRNTERTTTTKTGNFFDGTPYSTTTTQKAGGAGAVGGSSGGGGGAGTNGYGGGGGGAKGGNGNGGTGGSNNGNGAAGGAFGSGSSGGAGGTGNNTNANGVAGNNGASNDGGKGGNGGGSGGGGGGGAQISSPINISFNGGGGGGGGHKGNHAGILYLYSIFPITGAGQINLSGTNGYAGAKGGTGNNGGGGGGGGGAGGNGGKLFIKAPVYGFSVDISAGAGGAGGPVSGGAGQGGAGGAGQTGNTGAITVL